MDPNIEEMKYAELLTYAKSLDVDCHGKTRLTKSAIILKIKAHFEQKIVAEAAALAAEALKNTEPSTSAEAEKKVKKVKTKKSVKMADEAGDEEEEAPVKHKKKKASKEAEATHLLCVKCATPKASAKKKKTRKPKIELSFSQPKKSINRIRRNLNEEAGQEPEAVAEAVANESAEIKKKKKIKKQASRSKVAASVTSSPTAAVNTTANNQNEPVVSEPVPTVSITEPLVEQPHVSTTSPAQLTFSRKSQRLSNITTNLTTNLNRSSVANESSLLTNDNGSMNNEHAQAGADDNANITKDIMNTTFDKSTVEEKPTTSKRLSGHAFYHTSSPMLASTAPAAKTESPKVAAAVQPAVVAAEKPKPTGGARITRPSQTIKATLAAPHATTIVQEVSKDRVEVVQREAGPRIVKPTVLQENEAVSSKLHVATQSSHAKKIEKNAMDRIQKIKEGLANDKKDKASAPVVEPAAKKIKPIPDFKAIHEKNVNKMESIDNWQQRKQERTSVLSGAKPIVKSSTENSIATAVSQKASATKPPFTTSMRPKTPSRQVSSTPKLDCKITPIARVNEKSSIIESSSSGITSSQNDPTTPITNKTVSQFTPSPANTPTSAVRARANSLLKSAIKNSVNKLVNLNGSTLGSNEPPPTGSFQRRKSFDLNASLSKQLKYKPHTGKLKPVDFGAKSLFLASLAGGGASASAANNETRAVEKSSSTTSGVFRPIVNMNDTTTKVSSPLAQKRRESIKKAQSVRAETAAGGATNPKDVLTDLAKSKASEKSSMLLKKLNGEKAKVKKQESVDKNRNLKDLVANNENVAV